MPRYMLDTDTCSYIMKRSNSHVLERLSALPVSDVCISVITKVGTSVRSRSFSPAASGSSGAKTPF